jgi:hypothetical protein
MKDRTAYDHVQPERAHQRELARPPRCCSSARKTAGFCRSCEIGQGTDSSAGDTELIREGGETFLSHVESVPLADQNLNGLKSTIITDVKNEGAFQLWLQGTADRSSAGIWSQLHPPGKSFGAGTIWRHHRVGNALRSNTA